MASLSSLLRISVDLLLVAAACNAAPQQYWLAARFDGRQAMIYFDTVHFGDTWPSDAERLYPSDGFSIPSLLTPAYVKRIQDRPGAVHFAIGEKYDLLMDGNFIQSATVTKLIGWMGDEGVGNDSYIGAIVSLDNPDNVSLEPWLLARRHVDDAKPTGPARLLRDPVTFDVESNILGLLKPQQAGPMLTVQPFKLADGSIRYFARCGWNGDTMNREPSVTITAWLNPDPMLRVVATETVKGSYGFLSTGPRLLNVLDLGDGRTGMIMESQGDDSDEIDLLVYKDGPIGNMHVIQTLAQGE